MDQRVEPSPDPVPSADDRKRAGSVDRSRDLGGDHLRERGRRREQRSPQSEDGDEPPVRRAWSAPDRGGPTPPAFVDVQVDRRAPRAAGHRARPASRWRGRRQERRRSAPPRLRSTCRRSGAQTTERPDQARRPRRTARSRRRARGRRQLRALRRAHGWFSQIAHQHQPCGLRRL